MKAVTKKRCLLLSFLLASAGVYGSDATAQSVTPHTIKKRAHKLGAHFEQWERVMRARGVPGMVVVVVLGDEVVFSRAIGHRDPIAELPVTMDTPFYIASCTKSYLAMGVMSLVEEGRLKLDASVQAYLPRFELADDKTGRDLSIRDLLSHSKGLNSGPVVFLDAYSGEITDDRYYYWLSQAAPTGKFAYTNVHYTLLGRVIEAVSGQSWKEFLKVRLFEPAGMYQTSAYVDQLYGSNKGAIPCEHNGTQVVHCRVRKNDKVMHAAGGLGASGNDLARWLRLNLSDGSIDGRRIVSSETIAAMQSLQSEGPMPSRNRHRQRDGYGYGWFVGQYRGFRLVDHGGGYAGTSATISFMPQKKLGIAVVSNASSSLAERVALTIYDELLGFERSDLLEKLEASCERQHKRVREWNHLFDRRPVSQDRLTAPIEQYVGAYSHPHWGTAYVAEINGLLQLTLGSMPVRIKSTRKDEFEVSITPGDADAARFEVDGKGVVAALIYDESEDRAIRFDRQ